jgi:hypothetical protein
MHLRALGPRSGTASSNSRSGAYHEGDAGPLWRSLPARDPPLQRLGPLPVGVALGEQADALGLDEARKMLESFSAE